MKCIFILPMCKGRKKALGIDPLSELASHVMCLFEEGILYHHFLPHLERVNDDVLDACIPQLKTTSIIMNDDG